MVAQTSRSVELRRYSDAAYLAEIGGDIYPAVASLSGPVRPSRRCAAKPRERYVATRQRGRPQTRCHEFQLFGRAASFGPVSDARYGSSRCSGHTRPLWAVDSATKVEDTRDKRTIRSGRLARGAHLNTDKSEDASDQ